jgi:hypothetical protein
VHVDTGYLVLPFVAIISSLILLGFLTRQKRVRYSERLRLPFFLIFTFNAMVILTEMGAMTAPSPNAELVWAKAGYTTGVLTALVLCGVVTWLYRPAYKDSWVQEVIYTVKYAPYVVTLLWGLSILVFAWFFALSVEGPIVKAESWFLIWVGGGAAWALGYIGLFSHKSLQKQDAAGRHYVKVIALAFSLIIIFYVVLILAPPTHEPYNLGYLATILPLVALIRVMRVPTVLGALVPVAEKTLPGKPEFKFEAGGCYMVREGAYDIFRDQLSHGMLGVCMSKLEPERIRERYEFRHTPIVWFTFREAEDTLSPRDLEGAKQVFSEVLDEDKGGIILVDCFDVFKTANGFERAVKFLREMKKRVARSRWSVLFSVNPRLFTGKQLGVLERELREVGA